MIHSLSLESFDQIESSLPEESTIYKDGYDQGVTDTHMLHEADQAKLAAELIQSISDLEFKYVEARAEITASLAPLFSTVIQKVLPACAKQGFIIQITALLCDSAALSVDTPLKIAVHPSQKNAVGSLLEEYGSRATISADEKLPHHAAWITHEREERHIDLDAVTQKIEMILSTIVQPHERNQKNG